MRLRVWPNDLDLNFHVNNGRYLSLADLGRIDYFIRSGLFELARRERAFPIVGDAIAKFRRDMKLFECFEIETRMLGWDHNGVYGASLYKRRPRHWRRSHSRVVS